MGCCNRNGQVLSHSHIYSAMADTEEAGKSLLAGKDDEKRDQRSVVDAIKAKSSEHYERSPTVDSLLRVGAALAVFFLLVVIGGYAFNRLESDRQDVEELKVYKDRETLRLAIGNETIWKDLMKNGKRLFANGANAPREVWGPSDCKLQ